MIKDKCRRETMDKGDKRAGEFVLEVCVDSIESALIASECGASRIELCQNLIIGGTTPSYKIFELLRKSTQIKTHILIRPRFGDFCYSDYELDLMVEEVKLFRSLGAEGVVIGMLQPDGRVHRKGMERLIEAAEEMSITFHRAFDMTVDPMIALEESISLGVNTILTSGQKNHCMDGLPLLRQMQRVAEGRIVLMAGAGVNGRLIPTIYEETGIVNYHMSGKIDIGSKMIYRKEDVFMGLDQISEYTLYQTSKVEVLEAMDAITSRRQ